jgi:acetyltransferase
VANLDRIFNPKSVAVIGASDTAGKVGYTVMKNLVSDYRGKIYPINITKDKVQGIRAYHSIKDVPEKVDLVVIATPAITVPSLIDECGQAGVGGLVIITAGFKEAGEEGTKLYNQLIETAAKYNIKIIGPNCLGFMRPKLNLNASFADRMPLDGRIAFISQSGALGTAILDWSLDQGIGFSYFVSVGSMMDVSFHDLIDYFGADPNTESILIYMESLADAKKFISAARAVGRTKPIIVLKVGRSSEGSKAAKSHTGSITGNDAVFDAAFKRAGILRVDTIGELFDSAEALSMQSIPKGKRLAIVTNAGGPGVIATDYLIGKGGELAQLSKETTDRLNRFLPADWSHGNPVDILGDATPEIYKKAVDVCLDDPNTDALAVILTPQAMTEPSNAARQIAMLPNKSKKTILASWMGEKEVNEGRKILRKAGIPAYRIPENAVRCFMNMYRYSENIEMLYETPASIPHAFKPKTNENREIIKKAFAEKRFTLTEEESKELLSNYDIPTSRHSTAKTAKEAAAISKKLGYPVVMKILSPDIMHKTDVGGVELNISSEDEAKKAFNRIMKSVKKKAKKAKIYGILVEKMASKKYELLIGSKKDSVFGPVIVFGMGGVAVEVFKDINMALPPLNMSLSKRLMEGTKIYQLLKGYRGMKGVDISSIQFLLYKFAYLVMDFPEIKEIDINPFAVDEKGGVVLDAKIVLDEAEAGKDVVPYSHLAISPYPKEYISKFVMKNGSTALLRPIKPEDESMLAEMFEGLSEETQRLRFFAQIKDITHDLLVRYTQIDYDREISIIAETGKADKKEIAGAVRLVKEPYDSAAEFAVLVGDKWQNQGLGNKLTDYALEIAKKKGIDRVYAKLSPDNMIIAHMFKKRGFEIKKKENFLFAELYI